MDNGALVLETDTLTAYKVTLELANGPAFVLWASVPTRTDETWIPVCAVPRLPTLPAHLLQLFLHGGFLPERSLQLCLLLRSLLREHNTNEQQSIYLRIPVTGKRDSATQTNSNQFLSGSQSQGSETSGNRVPQLAEPQHQTTSLEMRARFRLQT